MLLRSAKGTRTLEAEKFFSGPMATSARPDECLEEIHWPAWSWRRTGSAFTEISVRHGDFAMIAAAAQVSIDGDGRCVRAAFGVGGAGGTPLAFPKIAARLVGTRLDDAVVARADDVIECLDRPIGGHGREVVPMRGFLLRQGGKRYKGSGGKGDSKTAHGILFEFNDACLVRAPCPLIPQYR